MIVLVIRLQSRARGLLYLIFCIKEIPITRWICSLAAHGPNTAIPQFFVESTVL